MDSEDPRAGLGVIVCVIAAAVIWLALGAWALADPSATWGASSARLERCHEADACVTVINRLSAAPDLVATLLDLDGLTVEVDVVMGAGKEPDRVRVIAPRGWLVVPPWADVPEDGVVVFKLMMPEMG